MAAPGHRQTASLSQNHKAQLASAYNELGKELSSQKIRVVGNYTLGRVIGEGAYGKVRMGVHRLTGTRVAIKQIPKAMSAALTREIHHHRQLHHPHVTQLYEVIATENNIWLVTELCSGGELFDYLAEKGRLEEDETRLFFGQLCLAVAYIHEKGIVHRDLKLENALLDERCRVKLGDFGFTREFERGVLLETFCGTTGYASPEMLLCEKYLGPEVDVWSLGVILYTLLTGTLPFDDDDEMVMKEKVIKGVFEDPEWLSDEARDLLKSILQVNPSKRLTIAQILAHPWFEVHRSTEAKPLIANEALSASRPASLKLVSPPSLMVPQPSSALSDSSFHSASSEVAPSTPSTPDEPVVDVASTEEQSGVHRNSSDATLRQNIISRLEHVAMSKVQEESPDAVFPLEAPVMRPSLSRATTTSQGSNKGPPALPTRTPVRTKRRSVSSTLSEHAPLDKLTTSQPPDFSSLLNTPAPLIFSTPLERDLLNSLSALGFDTGQIVHSVLADACDATGSLWWMLKRKAERKAMEDGTLQAQIAEVHGETGEEETSTLARHNTDGGDKDRTVTPGALREHSRSPIPAALVQTHSAPELQFIPATPTAPTAKRADTPPRATSPPGPLLSPASATPTESASRSHPSTPSGSMKDKDGSKGRKARSGSVSIMQRATTALEAAGIVRKKSTEGVRDDKNSDKRGGSAEESRSSGSGRLKSPPLKPMKDGTSTPPPALDPQSAASLAGSPWVITASRNSTPATPTSSPGDSLGALPTIGENGAKLSHGRNRASLLSTFRLWFKEDPKGKRKAPPPALDAGSLSYPPPTVGTPSSSPINGRGRGTIKGRIGSSYSKAATGRKVANRAKRGSVSSRRSSSVNSKRSSGTSAQIGTFEPSPSYNLEQMAPVSRQRSDPSRRSFGSRTPNSERDEFISRPSSVHSFVLPPQRHRKSPSASSSGSMYPGRTGSPLPSKIHRRGGSGSSTRVVRQMQQNSNAHKQNHLRSNSTSSNHSLSSSRHGSLYELSESEGIRTGSPTKFTIPSLDDTPRRAGASTFLAQKRNTPFSAPGGSGYLHSIGRSSWKKSWGLEPPGWQSRTQQAPIIEVLSISPAVTSAGIRDVFTGRQSMGDDSDWVDEDDEIPGYAGGLGQIPVSAPAYTQPLDSPVLSSRSRPTQSPTSKRTGASLSVNTSNRNSRGKGRSPMGRSSPLPPPAESPFEAPPEPRGVRRGQLPNSRSGPAFRQAIQEEDEDEE